MRRPGITSRESGVGRQREVDSSVIIQHSAFPPHRSSFIVHRSPPAFRRGLSLLEVILALAILAGSVAALGELMRTGMMSATDARDYTRAELHAESIMSQVVAGVMSTGSVSNAPIEDDPNFIYSMFTEQVDQAGLLGVHVTVTHVQTSQRKPVEFTLTRWMVDPQMELELATQAQATAVANAEARAAAEENASSSSSSSGSSSGGSSSGGSTKSGGGQ